MQAIEMMQVCGVLIVMVIMMMIVLCLIVDAHYCLISIYTADNKKQICLPSFFLLIVKLTDRPELFYIYFFLLLLLLFLLFLFSFNQLENVHIFSLASIEMQER